MELTMSMLIDIEKRYNLTSEEFLSMINSNDYNMLEDKDLFALAMMSAGVALVVGGLRNAGLIEEKNNPNGRKMDYKRKRGV